MSRRARTWNKMQVTDLLAGKSADNGRKLTPDQSLLIADALTKDFPNAATKLGQALGYTSGRFGIQCNASEAATIGQTYLADYRTKTALAVSSPSSGIPNAKKETAPMANEPTTNPGSAQPIINVHVDMAPVTTRLDQLEARLNETADNRTRKEKPRREPSATMVAAKKWISDKGASRTIRAGVITSVLFLGGIAALGVQNGKVHSVSEGISFVEAVGSKYQTFIGMAFPIAVFIIAITPELLCGLTACAGVVTGISFKLIKGLGTALTTVGAVIQEFGQKGADGSAWAINKATVGPNRFTKRFFNDSPISNNVMTAVCASCPSVGTPFAEYAVDSESYIR